MHLDNVLRYNQLDSLLNYEFYILDATNLGDLPEISHKDIGSSNQTSINGLYVKDYLAFLITNSQFQIWDIKNQTEMVPWTEDGSINKFLSFSSFGAIGSSSVFCSENIFYTALKSSQGNNKDLISIITADYE